MDRDRILVLIAFPIIAFALFLLWKEYGEYYGKPPITQIPDVPQLSSVAASISSSGSAPVSGTKPSSSRGLATERVPKGRTAEQTAVIIRAKSTPVSVLDSSLPPLSTEHWIETAAGASAQILWEVNDCGGAAKVPEATPVCAQADIDLSDGTKFQAALLMGTRTLKSHEVQYGAPSLLWAVYTQSGSDALTPAPLKALTRIAQQGN